MSRDILGEAIAIARGSALQVPTPEHVEILLGTLQCFMKPGDFELMILAHTPPPEFMNKITFMAAGGRA